MSAQVTPIRPPLSASQVVSELLKLQRAAQRTSDRLLTYADQCDRRADVAKRWERNLDQITRFKAMRQRAIDRAAQAMDLYRWCDEAYTDWTFGKLTAKEVLGNVHMAHEMLTHIGHPAGSRA